MIVVDTSALAAIRQLEPQADRFRERLAPGQRRIVPATCRVEFSMLRPLGHDRHQWLRDFMQAFEIEIAPIDAAVAQIAADAAERYGRGSGHPARLNFGDCMSYAVAKHLEAPLLYKGDDFLHTDIKSALAT